MGEDKKWKEILVLIIKIENKTPLHAGYIF